ncbi:MAG: FecR domain-containing protein [Flavobacteriaceae bacterium]
MLSKYAKDIISEKELDELLRLLKDSNSKDKVKKELDVRWNSLLSEESNVGSKLPEGFFEKILEKAKAEEEKNLKKRIGKSPWSRIAASFVGLIVVGCLSYFILNTNTSVDLVSQYTGVGEQKTVLLPDGSKVFLNVSSQITYPEEFTDTIREIFLEGEAFFKVARNERQAFVIRTGDLKTRVLGTSFNVRAYLDDKEVEVSVATGKVMVHREVHKSSHLDRVILQSGEQAVYGTQTGNLTKQYVDIDLMTPWRDGILVFEKTRLKDVLKTLERWYDVDMVLNNDAIADCLIRSQLESTNLDDVLETLKFILNIEYEKANGKVIFKGGFCGSQ